MKLRVICLVAFMPALVAAEGLTPLDNEAMSESRVNTGLASVNGSRERLEEVEEQQRLLPDAESPAARPSTITLPPASSGLTPAQQQFVDSFRDAVNSAGAP